MAGNTPLVRDTGGRVATAVAGDAAVGVNPAGAVATARSGVTTGAADVGGGLGVGVADGTGDAVAVGVSIRVAVAVAVSVGGGGSVTVGGATVGAAGGSVCDVTGDVGLVGSGVGLAGAAQAVRRRRASVAPLWNGVMSGAHSEIEA